MKKNLGLFLILFFTLEFFIYFSDINLIGDITIHIFIFTVIICYYLSVYLKLNGLRIFYLLSVTIIALMFFLWEFAFGGIKGKEYISQTWSINEFEIQSVTQSPFAGPSDNYYRLRETYVFGLLYKELDINTEDFRENGKKCIVEFKDVNKIFDLCKSNQLK